MDGCHRLWWNHSTGCWWLPSATATASASAIIAASAFIRNDSLFLSHFPNMKKLRFTWSGTSRVEAGAEVAVMPSATEVYTVKYPASDSSTTRRVSDIFIMQSRQSRRRRRRRGRQRQRRRRNVMRFFTIYTFCSLTICRCCRRHMLKAKSPKEKRILSPRHARNN